MFTKVGPDYSVVGGYLVLCFVLLLILLPLGIWIHQKAKRAHKERKQWRYETFIGLFRGYIVACVFTLMILWGKAVSSLDMAGALTSLPLPFIFIILISTAGLGIGFSFGYFKENRGQNKGEDTE